MFLGSLVAVELLLWTLSFLMDWEPVETLLGSYPCILNTYIGDWRFTDNFDIYLGANTEFGVLEAFGLPITSGLIGGTSATPAAAPYICTNATVIKGPSQHYTSLRLFNEEYWGQVYNTAMTIRYPAGSHSWSQYSEYDLTQNCQLSLVTGTGEVTFVYTSDEWGSITNNQLSEIALGHTGNTLRITPGMQPEADFASIITALGQSQQTFQNITEWISQGVSLAFNVSRLESFTSSQETGASQLVWALNLDGKYNPEHTWKGVSASVAGIAHYVLNQGDASLHSICAYNGINGVGILDAPEWISTVITVLVIISICFGAAVVASWLFIVGGNENIDRAAQIFDHPLRIVYYMRQSLSKLVTKIRGDDIGQISLVNHLRTVRVRFGEDKSTRGNEIGNLTLDTPKNVVKMAKNREFS
ncbi:UNVERIFIED_CONTAM: hypothetical protein HDU68_004931 [Siphonaria sp. JEL0065]|nr:hypothetical protein HDU68_004931 [Siphonaria sp. JEL0065]